jgi:hypothetical protein
MINLKKVLKKRKKNKEDNCKKDQVMIIDTL